MKITRDQKEQAVEMYLKDYSYRDIMAKLNISKNQLQWCINRINFQNSKESVRQQRIEKAFNMEANIFQRIAEGKSIVGYDTIFCSFCA